MLADSAIGKCLLITFIAMGLSACAAFQPIDPNGPQPEGPLYPVSMADAGTRLEEASLAWFQLSQRYGLPEKTEANLDPYTATLQSLPANLSTPVYLPKVGSQANQTEEETRESLRRFIVEWQRLIGAEPDELSLVERSDGPSGIKLARYEQRPFRYPLRGGYGNLLIRFRSDGQLLEFSSNCIPNADRLQATLSSLTPKLNREQAASRIKTQPVTVSDQTGQPKSFTLTDNATVEARQLVVYARPSTGQSGGLEIRLAWELDVTNGPVKKVYLDAISNEIIATT